MEFHVPTLLWPVTAAVLALFPPPSEHSTLGEVGGSWIARDPDREPAGHGVVGRIGSARLRHGAEVRSLAFSPNGGLVVAADCQRTVIVWEAETGRVVRRWDLPARVCGPVGFSADGRRVTWCLGDGCWRSIDIRSGMEIQANRRGATKAIQAFKTPGQFIAIDSDGRHRMWDEASGRPGEFIEPDDRRTRSPCGRYEAAVTAPSVLTCIDVATGMERAFSPGDDRLHRLGCLHFSADCRFLFASAFGGRVVRFDRSTGAALNRYGPLPANPDCLAVSPDGDRLAVSAGNRIHLLDVASGGERFPQPEAFPRPPAMRLSADGKCLVLSGGYPSPREEVWDLGTLRKRSGALIPRPVWEERMSPFPLVAPTRGVRVSFGGIGRGFSQFDTSVLSFSDENGKPLWSVKKGLPGRGGYAFSADGAWVAVVEENSLAVYETATGQTVRDLPYTGALARREWAHGVAFTPDAFAVITAHASGLVYWPIRNTTAPREVRLPPGQTLDGRESLLAVSPDGRTVVVGNDRFELIVFELATLAERFRLSTRPRGPAATTLFARDGRHLFVANGDATVTIHDLAVGEKEFNYPSPSPEAVWADLASNDAAAAFRSMRQLAVEPGQTTGWLRFAIRAAPPDDRIARWIGQLDAPRYPTREAAQRELARLGHAARSALLAASRTELSAECRRRVEALLEGTRGPDLSVDGIRIGRAVEVVERLGTPESVELLREWAGGPDGMTLVECARLAIGRLER
jgi:WD40 repeat protein